MNKKLKVEMLIILICFFIALVVCALLVSYLHNSISFSVRCLMYLAICATGIGASRSIYIMVNWQSIIDSQKNKKSKSE